MQFMSMRYDDKSSTSEILQQQDYIFFSVYGIREPGQEIKVDVLKLITKKLEGTTLDLINQQIARNPKCKLTPQDVEVISFNVTFCESLFIYFERNFTNCRNYYMPGHSKTFIFQV